MRSPRPWCHVDYPCGLTPSPGLPGLPGLPVDYLGLPHAPSVTSVSRLPARQFNGGLAPLWTAALPSQTEQIVWKHGDAWRCCQPLTRRDRQPGSCLLEGARTVRTTDPDPDLFLPWIWIRYTLYLGCAVISDGARSRPSELDCACGSAFTGRRTGTLSPGPRLHSGSQFRLGYSALFGPPGRCQRGRRVSECGMCEKCETEIFTAGSTKASRSSFVAASVAGSPFLALAGDALPSVPGQTKA